eukprot:763026-Hanusia_phi.AAC.4
MTGDRHRLCHTTGGLDVCASAHGTGVGRATCKCLKRRRGEEEGKEGARRRGRRGEEEAKEGRGGGGRDCGKL